MVDYLPIFHEVRLPCSWKIYGRVDCPFYTIHL